MASRVSLHSQLSSIIETMAMSALMQVCELVDEDSAELRLGLSQLLAANSALVEKVNSLECELSTVRSEAPRLCKTNCSVGVQTVCHTDGDAYVSGSPTIEGIFGKDWCMNLWKDRDPYSFAGDSPQCSDSVATESNEISVTEIKEEDCVKEAPSNCQETLCTEENEESTAEEPEILSVGNLAHGSTCSLSLDQDGEQVVCAGGMEAPLMQMISINDTEDAFSTLNSPIEEEDDITFPEEIQQELMINTKDGRRNSENIAALDELLDDFNMPGVESAGNQEKEIFTCQICSRTFFHKRTLTLHMKSHKSNFCNICKQHFLRKNKLKSHTCMSQVQPHRDSKSCEICGKTFANPSAVRIHYVVHTGEKPHRCGLCGKGFTQKGNLKCHIRIHTGEKPFCCIKCGKTFTQKVNLNHHLMGHKDLKD